MTIYVKRKNVKFLSQIWTQKFRYYCLFRELFEIFMGLCRNILHKKGVLASKSHRGRHENMWKQSGDNFERKKNFYFFDDFWAQKFRRNVILYPPKMDFLQLQGGVKNFWEYEDKQKFLWNLRHRAFKRTNTHVHTTSRKKVPGIFRKKRSLVYPLE